MLGLGRTDVSPVSAPQLLAVQLGAKAQVPHPWKENDNSASLHQRSAVRARYWC